MRVLHVLRASDIDSVAVQNRLPFVCVFTPRSTTGTILEAAQIEKLEIERRSEGGGGVCKKKMMRTHLLNAARGGAEMSFCL